MIFPNSSWRRGAARGSAWHLFHRHIAGKVF
jgi:hypothetical protein